MRKFSMIVAVMLAAVIGVGPAAAQVKMPVMAPKVNLAPKAAKVKPAIKILPKVIPPSVALTRAMQQAPGAKPLNVTLNKNNMYVVKLLQGNKVKLLRIPAAP